MNIYSNPRVLASSVLVREPNLESVLFEIGGHTHRLAVEHSGVVTARGERLRFSEHIAWAASDFSTLLPERALDRLFQRIKGVSLVTYVRKQRALTEFGSWKDFEAWLGRPSELLGFVDWKSCRSTSVYLPDALNFALEDRVRQVNSLLPRGSRTSSKRRIIAQAIEEYLENHDVPEEAEVAA